MESLDELTQNEQVKKKEFASIIPKPVEPIAVNSGNAKLDPTTLQTPDQAQSRILIERDDPVSEPELIPLYPQLTHEPVESPRVGYPDQDSGTDDDEDGPAISRPFLGHPAHPPDTFQRNRGSVVSKVGDEGVMRMHRFTLYETQSLYYIIGSDILRKSYRILKISRTSDEGELDITEDEIVYTQRETQQIVNAIDEGNRITGGLKIRHGEFWGVLGFVKFTNAYYMVIVTKRSHIAVLGGHYIDKIDGSEMIPLTTSVASKSRMEKQLEENRLLNIFSTVDLTKGFYFSHSYDITRTLQHNILRERRALGDGFSETRESDYNGMFIWNDYLLEPARKVLHNVFDWCVAVTHGYIDQSALSVYWGRVVYITIIARRSRFFAGARYLKRGANDLGYVANDVETEQIVSEMQTESFHAPGPRLFANSNYTSYVQHRGSIPLYWTQDTSGVSPKPDIHLNVVDPFFSAAALHFDNLFDRYGTPIYVLNLIKQRERIPREGKLLNEYGLAISYLNQFLPDDKQILYKAFDMSRAAKAKEGDVIGDLEEIAEEILLKTGFFHNGVDVEHGLQIQQGIARTNCIDCLDRTNAAQFVIGKKALGHQLQALGIVESTAVEFDSDAVTLFTNMWQDHGDTIAIQYGGSHLVNTMSTYRKINQWTSHTRDMVESFKRFYNNSFLDAQRQESYNLFLGNYIYRNGHPMLWDLSSDYYLHHTEPRSMFGRRRPSYRKWYTPAYLESPTIPPTLWSREIADHPLEFFDDYWAEYYRPFTLSSFRKLFAFKIKSNLTFIDVKTTSEGRFDLSPFVVRTTSHESSHQKEKPAAGRRKGVKVIAPSEESKHVAANNSSIDARLNAAQPEEKLKPQSLGTWIDAQQQAHASHKKYTGIIKDSSWERASRTPTVPAMPPANAIASDMPSQPTKQEIQAVGFTQLVANSLDPKVRQVDEYRSYMAHPETIQLVTSTKTDYSKAPKEYIDYFARVSGPTGTFSDNIFLIDDYGAASMTVDERAELNTEEYQEYVSLGLRENPLTVLVEDSTTKRYKKYQSWLRGKSLFKQKNVLGGELV